MKLKSDPKLERLVSLEERRQVETIDLIPSENFAYAGVRELSGSVLANKYSEGYPGKRYYPGNRFIDEIERLAEERGRRAFHLGKDWRVNVQPYSGSPANIAVYLGLMELGDVILGMDLAAGGHLTHGHKVNFSGRGFRSVSYGIGSDGLIDYNALEKIAIRMQPKVIVSGLTAYPRAIDFARIGKIAERVRAYHVADISHISGLVSAGLHPSPFACADVVTTTTHKMLRGPRGAVIFSKAALSDSIDRAVFPGLQGGPHDNTTAGIAYTFGQVMKPQYKSYAKQILKNANALAEALIKEGFALVTGGTDNHLMLIDLRPLSLDGKTAETLLEEAGIIANRNSIPGDAKPLNPSGLRLGTPAITARGLKERDVAVIARWISRILIKKEKPPKIGKEVKSFLKRFPIR